MRLQAEGEDASAHAVPSLRDLLRSSGEAGAAGRVECAGPVGLAVRVEGRYYPVGQGTSGRAWGKGAAV